MIGPAFKRALSFSRSASLGAWVDRAMFVGYIFRVLTFGIYQHEPSSMNQWSTYGTQSDHPEWI